MFLHSPPAAQTVSYLFVDGECLNRLLDKIEERYFGNVRPLLDWRRVRGLHRKVFYYDAIPVQKPAEDDNTYSTRVAPKRRELAEIERQSGYHVRTGEAHHRRRRGNEQKMVDVQLAVDALLMASRGLFASCTLLTGDLDFKPLVTALVDMGVDVYLLYPEDETNDDLQVVADSADTLTVATFRQWFSDSFSQKTFLPEAVFTFQSDVKTHSTKLAQWHDDRYGDCYVTNDANIFELITERSIQNPNTHRLEMKSSNEGALRAYAEDVFSLIVPTW
jgi:uncharacterized LabA/DUF88 family protein